MTMQEIETWKAARPDPEDTLRWARDAGIRQIDVKFADLVGGWQHFSMPLHRVTEDAVEEGFGFDGSSIRGFQKIHESDMVLLPDLRTAFVDPFCATPTLSVTCTVHEPVSLAPYARDPRRVALRAEDELRRSGIATTSYWGPEVEFYVFNSLAFDQTSHSGFYLIDSDEGIWNSGKNGSPNLAYRPRTKEGYFPVPPTDKLQDLRSEMVENLLAAGVDVEAHHHEVGTAGQCEIDLRYGGLTEMADRVLAYKYIIKNTASNRGYVATFMPKPIFQDNGSGMHVHQSLFNGDTNLFFDPNGYGLLSTTARHYVGGLLAHAPAILAFAAPDHQLLPPLGPRVRSADQSRLFAAEPKRLRPDPDLLGEPARSSHRIPPPGSLGQPVSRLQCHAPGRSRWDQAPHRTAAADRSRSL